MPRFYDSKGNAHVLIEELGRGGEGIVYACQENEDLVAKIYHEPIDEEKAKKLRWMAENSHERLLKVAAWVVETLHEKPHGEVVGFLMPKIKAKEIHELYSLKSRRVYFPEATWEFLVHTATNLARAFYSLHKYEHVMGDVNHGNCVVLADGTVKLIDCDSFAIKTDEKRYSCEVGVATHLAPELQKSNLSEAERLPKHDNFGLAVILFQILFLGRHPFSGNYLGEQDKSLEDCIREYRFAYGKNARKRKVAQPPGTLLLSEVSPKIAEYFEKAFDKESPRPTPKDWVEELVNLSKNLKRCDMHPGHHYFNQSKQCPWCRIESQTGLMLFPFKTSKNEKDFNIFTIENLIANFDIPRNLPAKLPKTEVLPPPSKEIIEQNEKTRLSSFVVVGGYFFLLIFLYTTLGFSASFFWVIGLSTFCISYINNRHKELKESLRTNLEILQDKWAKLEKDWNVFSNSKDINDGLFAIRKKIDEYQKLQKESVKLRKRLRDDYRRQSFRKHIRSFRLENEKILGVTEKEKQGLIKKGVRTAAEIEEKRLLDFHKIDDKLASKLLSWRKEVEKEFKPNSIQKLPEGRRQQLAQETATKRHLIEKEIEGLLGNLRSSSVFLRQQQQKIVAKSEEIAASISQVESNILSLSKNGSVATWIIIVTAVFTQIVGFVYSSSKPLPATQPVYERTNPPPTPAITEPIAPVEMSEEDFSDEEIKDLSTKDRERIANNLLDNASDLLYRDKNYYLAEKTLKNALRYDEKNKEVLIQLGSILYETDRFKESLKYYKKVLEIDKKDNHAKIFIGINHLQLKNFEKAKVILLEVSQKDNSYVAFYNLGLAYSNLKQYKSAEKAFRQSIKRSPKDAEAHYQLGYIYYKLNKKEEFGKQYSKLLELNETLAEKLLEETYKLPPSKEPKIQARKANSDKTID